MKPDKNCRLCDGTGVMYIQNGPDDYTKEQCVCTERAASIDEILAYLRTTALALPL